jgi:hypothetical protein
VNNKEKKPLLLHKVKVAFAFFLACQSLVLSSLLPFAVKKGRKSKEAENELL